MQTVTRRDGLSTARVNLVTKEMGFSVSLLTGNKSFLLLRFFKQLENVAKNINVNLLFSLSGASKNQMGAAVTLPPASLLVLLVKTPFSLNACFPSSRVIRVCTMVKEISNH